MRLITKIALGILAVLGILEALIVTAYWWPLPGSRPVFARFATISRIGILSLAGVVLLASTIMLLVAIFRRTKQAKLSIDQQRGRVSVSEQAVANAVTRAIKSKHAVNDVDVQIALNQRDGVRAKITADPRRPTDLVHLAKAIEATARRQLATVLGMPAKHVAVTLRPT